VGRLRTSTAPGAVISSTPRGVIDKPNAEINRVLTIGDMRDKLISQGTDALSTTPEQFAARIKADAAQFAKIIKSARIKLEN
jgi:tripartite-type tricarboxylate transporter receptor subunit TctC